MEARLPPLVIALALVQFVDAVACMALPQIKAELDRLRCPTEYQRLLPGLKFASGLGLVVGLWVPLVGTVTCLALTIYFVLALSFHQRIEDRALRYVPASAMLLFSVTVMLVSFIPAT